jgi:hypothetical protein
MATIVTGELTGSCLTNSLCVRRMVVREVERWTTCRLQISRYVVRVLDSIEHHIDVRGGTRWGIRVKPPVLSFLHQTQHLPRHRAGCDVVPVFCVHALRSAHVFNCDLGEYHFAIFHHDPDLAFGFTQKAAQFLPRRPEPVSDALWGLR